MQGQNTEKGCAVCNGKKLKFIKEQEASELLSSLEIKIPLSKTLKSIKSFSKTF